MKKKAKTRIGIVGISGRMGKSIVVEITKSPDVILASGCEHKKHKDIGKDIGIVTGNKPIGKLVTSNHKEFCKNVDVIIEFGLEKATKEYLAVAKKNKIAFISGSTALSKNTLKDIQLASKHIPVFWSPNMSLGANLINLLSKFTTTKLGKDFDIDITDLHHRHKKDTPSGTAKFIQEEIKDSLKKIKVKKKVNISALRSGDSTGEHSIIFSGEGERVIIKHISSSRNIFASGAVRVAAWLHKKRPGFYNMSDFLKI